MTDIKFLLIDDMSSMRGVTKMFLMDAGYTSIDEAADGSSALKMLQNHQYEFIICDWDMPKMTGLELLIEVRKDEKLKHLPFLMLTATNKLEKVKAAIEAGVSDYIAKPFQPQVLVDKINDCLAKH
jgi:two-component system, chemotaxis family, chemotaxis protein CheY